MNSPGMLGQVMSISSQQSPITWQMKSQLQVWVAVVDRPLQLNEPVQQSTNPAAEQEPISVGCVAMEGGREGESEEGRKGWREDRREADHHVHSNYEVAISYLL